MVVGAASEDSMVDDDEGIDDDDEGTDDEVVGTGSTITGGTELELVTADSEAGIDEDGVALGSTTGGVECEGGEGASQYSPTQ